jgi:hypothetical protein
MLDRDDDQLTGPLARATDGLRDGPVVRPEWRDELLRRAAAEPVAEPRRLSISVPWAIAAGIACAIAGGAVVELAARRGSPALPPAAAVAVRHSPANTPTMLPVKFSVVAPNAARVSIVGDFNDWNPTTLPMRRSADGRLWEVEVRLPLGRYSYAFMIDGRLAPDPGAPSSAGDDFGTPNSVLMVRGS